MDRAVFVYSFLDQSVCHGKQVPGFYAGIVDSIFSFNCKGQVDRMCGAPELNRDPRKSNLVHM